MAVYRGTQQIGKRYRGTTEIGKRYRGSQLIWQKSSGSSFSSGIIKTSNQLITNGAWTLITGWTANTAQFPGSVVTTDGIVIVGSGEMMVRVRGRFQQANTSNHRLQVRINGTAVGTVWLSGTSPQTIQFGGDETFFFSNGDLLQAYAWATSGTSNRRTMYGAADKTGTYLEVVPI